MKRSLATLEEACAWLIQHWSEREIPVRLHSRDTGDDGAPAFHPAFARHLSAKPDDVTMVASTRACSHISKPKDASDFQCLDCHGSGVYESETLVYRYPTWRAIDELYRTMPDTYDVVLTVVINGFSVEDACNTLRVTPEQVRLAIVAMYSRYQKAPLSRGSSRALGWTEKSEAQRNAESMVAVA